MSNSTATKAKATSSTGSRRSKKNQDETSNNTAMLEPTEANQESTLSVDKGTQLMTMPELKIQQAPKDEVFVAPLPGNRPISSSDLKLSNVVSIMGNRPVDASNIQVLGVMSAMGERPIIASNIKVADVISVSGERPIAASAIQIRETEMIMGNRPIASNYIDSEEDLMGYLD
jgi:hypothetical protein